MHRDVGDDVDGGYVASNDADASFTLAQGFDHLQKKGLRWLWRR
jgi:hypothetical protein